MLLNTDLYYYKNSNEIDFDISFLVFLNQILSQFFFFMEIENYK